LQEGNTLLLPGKPLLVEEACSGINSLFLCNAFCLFWVLWQRRSLLWLPLAMPATSMFVVLGNVIRITGGAAGYYYWKINLLSGWQHETFGLVLILVYCGLILSLDQFLTFLAKPVAAPVTATAEKMSPANDLSSANPRLKSVLDFRFAGVFLAVAGLGFFAVHLHANRVQKINSFTHLNRQEIKLTLPPVLADWQRVNSDAGDQAMVQTLGVHSLVWRFQRNGMVAVVAVDYPLDGFHNVKLCYTLNGWEILGEDELFAPQGQQDLHVIKLTLKQSVHHAVVYHSVVDANGNWLAPPKKLAGRLSSTSTASVPTGYRVQLIEGGYTSLSAADSTAAEALFFQARQLLVPQIVNQLRQPQAP
jgi:exosortase/archaeosortase family protein